MDQSKQNTNIVLIIYHVVNMPRKQERLSSQVITVNSLFVYRNLYNPNISDPVTAHPIDMPSQNPYAGNR